eukprot:UN28637
MIQAQIQQMMSKKNNELDSGMTSTKSTEKTQTSYMDFIQSLGQTIQNRTVQAVWKEDTEMQTEMFPKSTAGTQYDYNDIEDQTQTADWTHNSLNRFLVDVEKLVTSVFEE